MNDKTPTIKPKSNRRQHAIKSFKEKANERRSVVEKFADWLTACFGTVTFLTINAVWFSAWILINTDKVPFIEPFDPYPFGLLTMVVSLEAIFLAIIVLISQNREAKVAELREEVDLQINIIAEEEITKMFELMTLLLEKQGVKVDDDPELQRILGTSNEDIEKQLETQLLSENGHRSLKNPFQK